MRFETAHGEHVARATLDGYQVTIWSAERFHDVREMVSTSIYGKGVVGFGSGEVMTGAGTSWFAVPAKDGSFSLTGSYLVVCLNDLVGAHEGGPTLSQIDDGLTSLFQIAPNTFVRPSYDRTQPE